MTTIEVSGHSQLWEVESRTHRLQRQELALTASREGGRIGCEGRFSTLAFLGQGTRKTLAINSFNRNDGQSRSMPRPDYLRKLGQNAATTRSQFLEAGVGIGQGLPIH